MPFYDRVGKASSHWVVLTDIWQRIVETLKKGVRDMPKKRVTGLLEMSPIPQDGRSTRFGEKDLANGLLPENKFYRRMTPEDMNRVRSKGV